MFIKKWIWKRIEKTDDSSYLKKSEFLNQGKIVSWGHCPGWSGSIKRKWRGEKPELRFDGSWLRAKSVAEARFAGAGSSLRVGRHGYESSPSHSHPASWTVISCGRTDRLQTAGAAPTSHSSRLSQLTQVAVPKRFFFLSVSYVFD